MPADDMNHLNFLEEVLRNDLEVIRDKESNYLGSWKRRGGTGVFHVALARKWDRLEVYLEANGWNVFEACLTDTRKEGLREDLGDLRRYLALIEAELRSMEAKEEL